MALELRHIRYFVAIAEERNFTRAAARLGIGQPPLSQQIKDLEAELDVRLLRRGPHGADLTAAGAAFLSEAHMALAAVERAGKAAKRAARGQTGRLRIGCKSSAYFHPLVTGALRLFIETYPEVDVVLEEGNSADLLDQLQRGVLDAAFVRLDDEEASSWRVHHRIEETLVIALPRTHAQAGSESLALSDLRHERLILYPRHYGPALHDTVTNACRGAGYEPRLGQEARQFPSIVNLVASGLGISIVPASLARMKVDEVRFVSIADPAPTTVLMLVSNPDRAGDSKTLADFGDVIAALKSH